MPSARRPALLTIIPCPVFAPSHTGCRGATESSAARLARGSSSIAASTLVRSHVPAGTRAASAPSESSTIESGGSGTGSSDVRKPTPGRGAPGCACASSKPGRTVRPRSSMRRVARVAKRAISSLDPTATIRSPRIATASAHGRSESAVKILPPRRMMSAGGGLSCWARAADARKERSASALVR